MPLMNKIAKFATSPQGRRLFGKAKTYAQSPKGRAKIEQVQRQIAARAGAARSPASRPVRLRLPLAAVIAVALLLPSGSALAAGPPADYTKIAGLSDARYETRRETVRLPAFDGQELYIEIVRPRADGRFPVILESSPYHGTLADRDGTRILPGPKDAEGKPIGLTGYFAPRGYAARDDGPARHRPLAGLPRPPRPEGRPRPRAGRRVGRLARLVERQGRHDRPLLRRLDADRRRRPEPDAASRRSCRAPASRRCTTTSSRAACPAGCSASARWRPTSSSRSSASCRRSPTRAASTHTGDDFGNSMEQTGCGLPELVARSPARTSSPAATRPGTSSATGAPARPPADIPVFAVHGVNDNAARVAALNWFFERDRRAGRQAVARPVGPRLGLLPEPPRRPVDRRAARLVRQAARRPRRRAPARRSSCS